MSRFIAVLGGTPQDTRMGAEVLHDFWQAEGGGLDVAALQRPVAASPREQTLFQNASPEHREQHLREVLSEVQRRGAAGVYVYCNSLSGAVDLPHLAAEVGLSLVTPLMVYADWARRFRHLAVWSANASGQVGIERTLLAANPELRLVQFSQLALVEAIEAGQAPAQVVQQFRLSELAHLAAHAGAEAVLLGCTHFREFAPDLAPLSPLPLLDPAAEMWKRLWLLMDEGG